MPFLNLLAGLGLGAATGWLAGQQVWVLWQLLSHRDARRSLAAHLNRGRPGLSLSERTETEAYIRTHIVEDGIERIVYTPKQRRFQTPILMQHGMWHGAWCWELWQVLFAGWGWESHAPSLPGHGRSPTQRPIAACTLDYYLGFLKAEVDRLPRKPALMGHSMGGALTQWYLNYVADDLPAAVLVAPWVSHSTFQASLIRFLRLDPLMAPLMIGAWTATPMIRNPQRAARLLIGDRAVYSPAELYARLGPESALILYQHNPPLWSPPERVNTPMLWLAGEDDATFSEADEQRSAAHYKADYVVVEAAGHNLMMEYNYRQTAETIREWLIRRKLE